MTEEQIMQKLAKEMEDAVSAAMCGPVQKQPQTALRVTPWGSFETVQLDDVGRVIEPPPRCWKCGPVMRCSEHFVCT